MQSDFLTELTDGTQDAYDDLVVSIEASENQFGLLIAVCDDFEFREKVIRAYETELATKFQIVEVRLHRHLLSLRSAIAHEVSRHQKSEKPLLVTVLGTEHYSEQPGSDARSEQAQFLGYLQWTREQFREFSFPMVFWTEHSFLRLLGKQSPDFWSWRNGIFMFNSATHAESTPVAASPVVESPIEEKNRSQRLYDYPLKI